MKLTPRQRGERDGFNERGYDPPSEATGEARELYDDGFIDGAYTRLEAAYPDLSDATAEMHTGGKSDTADIIAWLFLEPDQKIAWARNGELDEYLDVIAGDAGGKTTYL